MLRGYDEHRRRRERLSKQTRRGRRDVVAMPGGEDGVLPDCDERALVAVVLVMLLLLLLLRFGGLLRAAARLGPIRAGLIRSGSSRRRRSRAAAVDIGPRHEEKREDPRG
jgi:hypothetical protein